MMVVEKRLRKPLMWSKAYPAITWEISLGMQSRCRAALVGLRWVDHGCGGVLSQIPSFNWANGPSPVRRCVQKAIALRFAHLFLGPGMTYYARPPVPPRKPPIGGRCQLSHNQQVYGIRRYRVRALERSQLDVESGDYCAVTGGFGSGKSTAMEHQIGLPGSAHQRHYLLMRTTGSESL